MRKQYLEGGYRSPQTTQERRALQDKNDKYGRRRNLPNTYDDIRVDSKRSWKHKRLKQYHVGGRGKKHTVYIPYHGRGYRLSLAEWDLQCYFREHNIPFNIVADRELHTETYVITHREVWVGTQYLNEFGDKLRWPRSIYETVKLKHPIIKKRIWSTTKGYYINFWTNKNLDLSQFGVEATYERPI